MNADTSVQELSTRLESAVSIADVRGVLADTLALPRTHPHAKALASVEERAFEYLRQVTATLPAEAAVIIQKDLLPRCLTHDGGARDDPWPRYAEMFADWFGQLPFEYQHDVRRTAYLGARARLDAGQISVGLRVIARVGYADEEVCRRLDDLLAAHDDELGDRILVVRASLGMTPKERERIRSTLHQRLKARINHRLISVAKRIGTIETIDEILKWMFLPPVEDKPRDVDDLFMLNALFVIASGIWDATFVSSLWKKIRAFADENPQREILRALDASVISGIPALEVVEDLIARLSRVGGVPRRVSYRRLKECVLPVHSLGWDKVTFESLGAVREDAIAESKLLGHVKTIEFDQKVDAWDVLLSAGRSEFLPSIDVAIRSNASGLAQSSFLELAACLGVSQLPVDVPSLLAGRPPDETWTQHELLIAQIGAVRAAHGAMSDEAFEALLGYRPTGGGILLSVIDALAEIAKSSATRGNRTRIYSLLSLAETSCDATQRSAAEAALAKLLEQGVLETEEAFRLATRGAAADVDPFTRRALLYAFAVQTDVEVPPELLNLAQSLATQGRSLTDEEQKAGIKEASLTLVASRLTEVKLQEFQAKRLGLASIDGEVHFTGYHDPPPDIYYLVGQWFSLQPVRYAPAVAKLLRTEDPRRVVPLMEAVRKIGLDNPREIKEALLERTHWMDGGRLAEPFAIDVLAAVAPDDLLADEWPLLGHWLPQARSAMADALGRILDFSTKLAASRENLLVRLTGDGLYGVRRIAYRAYANSAQEKFSALMVSWALSVGESNVEFRQRAAEGSAWVQLPGALDALHSLEWDPESAVREAYDKSFEERLERAWKQFHESRVLAAVKPEDVVRFWRHGCALDRLGDDSTIELLRQRSEQGLPPNVRFWLARVRKAVQSRWDDVVRKWPDPWFTRRGRYEMADGLIQWTDGTEKHVHAHLWLAPAEKLTGLGSWGGWAQTTEMNVTGMWSLAFAEPASSPEAHLHIPGRSAAQILVTRSFMPGGWFVFSGNGAYPDVVGKGQEELKQAKPEGGD
jgi:hypothetical protein